MKVYRKKQATRPGMAIMNTGDAESNLLLTGAHHRTRGHEAVEGVDADGLGETASGTKVCGTRSESVGDVDTGGITSRSSQSWTEWYC
jgi:hypothetical protein